jgi:6-phosphogluconolactonase (cycloisomerase 2 family)
MSAEVQYSASVAAQRVIADLGRTEDVQFSPSNRRLAVAAFHHNRIAVFDVAITRCAGKPQVALNGVVEIEDETLKGPHGLCFLDEDTLVVANRDGSVELFRVPAAGASTKSSATRRRTVPGGPLARIVTPGSVAAAPLDDDTIELLVCNNYVNSVTRHVLDRHGDFVATADETLLQRGLDVPDGICFSPDRRWVAVSNHNTHSVLLYDRSRRLGPDAEPDGLLRNVLCPHGVRFTFDQEFILVADAAARYVNVYKKDGETWSGTRDPVRLFEVVTPEVFARGRLNPQEGGPKGIDISRDTNVLVTTTELQTLAFFDVDAVIRAAEAPENRLKRYLQWRLSEAIFNRLGYMARFPVA